MLFACRVCGQHIQSHVSRDKSSDNMHDSLQAPDIPAKRKTFYARPFLRRSHFCRKLFENQQYRDCYNKSRIVPCTVNLHKVVGLFTDLCKGV